MQNSSLYEGIAQAHVDAFGAGYRGRANALAIVVSAQPLGKAAEDAIVASLDALGYPAAALGWLPLSECARDADPFTLIEAVDPLCVIVADHAAAQRLSASYNTALALECRTLLLGRPTRCFENFEALLSTEAGKQKAWKLLKTLPAVQ